MAADLWHDGGWTFAQPNGKPLDPRADHAEWKALLAESGVRETRLHDARHTAATMLMVLRFPSRAVMDVMGWSHESMAKRYTRVPNALRNEIAEQLGDLFWGDGDPEGAPGIAGN